MAQKAEPFTSPPISADVAPTQVVCNQCRISQHQHQPYCPENGAGLVKCPQCGLVFVGTRPDPNELYALYGETYFHNDESGVVGYSNYIGDEQNIRKTSRRRLKHVECFVKPGRMLDVGCAMGFFIDEAKKRGWQVQGMDVSSFAVEYARSHFGLDVQHGALTELDFPAGSYDLITLMDVIEHVPDPTAYVRRAAELLRSGGVLVLATPDVDSLPARLAGEKWVGYKLSEEHIYYFSVKTLTRMLYDDGFEVVNVRHVGKVVTLNLFLDRLSMYFSWLAKALQWGERAFRLSEWSLYVNPFDIVAVTARKR
jgi:SAM-dependent methyltransferase